MVSSRWLVVASVTLYAISLPLTAFTHDHGAIFGFWALAEGWFPAIFGIFAFIGSILHGQFANPYFGALSWFANLFMLPLWASLLLKFRPAAIFLATGAICTSSLFWLLDEIPAPDGGSMMHVHAGAGCVCWMGSMILGLIAGLLLEPAEEIPPN
jgi:hypothetical protein